MTAKIGARYSGLGTSGETDGVIVTGILTEVAFTHSSAIIWCEKRDCPCEVNLNTLTEQSEAKTACRKLWHDFHLGTEAEFELWWRFNMEG